MAPSNTLFTCGIDSWTLGLDRLMTFLINIICKFKLGRQSSSNSYILLQSNLFHGQWPLLAALWCISLFRLMKADQSGESVRNHNTSLTAKCNM